MAKARPRPAGRRGDGSRSWMVTSQPHQDAVAFVAMQHRGAFGPGEEIEVEIEFHVFGNQPDGDNAEKLVLDALQDAGVFPNDRRVKKCTWELFSCSRRDERTVITVSLRRLPPP